MEQMEQGAMKTGMCSCDCTVCRSMHGHRSHRWLVIIIGVLAIFWIGMKLGEIKGFMMAQYNFSGMRYEWMMDRDRTAMPVSNSSEVPSTNTMPMMNR